MERVTYIKNSILKHSICLVGVCLLWSGLALSQESEAVYIEKHGFSFIPPEGWEIKDNPLIALDVRAPKVEGQRYQSNIKIYKQKKPLSINERSIQDIKENLTSYFKDKAGLSDYSIRSHDTYKINEETNTIVIYSDYTLSGIELMQANVFIPHKAGRLVVNYTDYKKNVEGANSAYFSEQIWPSLASVQLDEQPELPYKGLMLVGAIALLFLIAIASLLLMKRRSSTKLYDKELDTEHDEKSKALEFDHDELEDGAVDLVEDISDEAQALEREMEAFSLNSPFSIQESVRLGNVDGKKESFDIDDEDEDYNSVV